MQMGGPRPALRAPAHANAGQAQEFSCGTCENNETGRRRVRFRRIIPGGAAGNVARTRSNGMRSVIGGKVRRKSGSRWRLGEPLPFLAGNSSREPGDWILALLRRAALYNVSVLFQGPYRDSYFPHEPNGVRRWIPETLEY